MVERHNNGFKGNRFLPYVCTKTEETPPNARLQMLDVNENPNKSVFS